MKNVEIFKNVTAKLMDLLRQTVFFFRARPIFKVAIIKTKSATIAFFSSTPFFLYALFFPFPFPLVVLFFNL